MNGTHSQWTNICNACVNELNTFDNLLKTAVDTELNFSYNTDNEFNQKISALNGFVDISVFHMNIRSLNNKKLSYR